MGLGLLRSGHAMKKTRPIYWAKDYDLLQSFSPAAAAAGASKLL